MRNKKGKGEKYDIQKESQSINIRGIHWCCNAISSLISSRITKRERERRSSHVYKQVDYKD